MQCGILQEDVMSPTLSEKCQFKVVSVNAPEEMEAENNETKEEVHIGECSESVILHADWLFVSHDQALRGGGLMMMPPVWPHPPKQRCGLYVMSSSRIM